MALPHKDRLAVSIISEPDDAFVRRVATIAQTEHPLERTEYILDMVRRSQRQSSEWTGVIATVGNGEYTTDVGYAWVSSRHEGNVVQRTLQRVLDIAYDDKPPVHIERVGVHAAYRRRGIGAAVLHSAIGHYDNSQTAIAYVTGAGPSRTWLEQCSFAPYPHEISDNGLGAHHPAQRQQMLSDIGSIKGSTVHAASMVDVFWYQPHDTSGTE